MTKRHRTERARRHASSDLIVEIFRKIVSNQKYPIELLSEAV